jgi:hypothetical protein
MWLMVACAGEERPADELPGHNDCLDAGEEMDEATCLAVVEDDGRVPTESTLAYGVPEAQPDDTRLTDVDYTWLTSEVQRCTCACCHTASWGGPGVHRWDLDFQPVWIDSASNWVLGVFGGWTSEPDQTLPSSDTGRVRAILEREVARRADGPRAE